ncbi:putative regulatory protein, FmdB family [Ectothiorhodospira mobilis]|uniref:Putative regulatory protein, FmdB family n=1 Tax=Ectothiorhodospira mobilis TaxID=195064 RepID=A0A1I4S376_ECTMO|nr:zinc ribbon domain-containing protein [Ectothiorhodospira mobilis]SFM58937.1 putative regulatory protein, FmdB family [Ectothiorhodospira mobilis]
MPIYEYECKACGHRMEAIQKLSDVPLVDCPACQAPALTKLVSSAGFRLGGSGWYETDFKKGNQRNLKKDSDSAPACAAGGDGGGSSCPACPAASGTASG